MDRTSQCDSQNPPACVANKTSYALFLESSTRQGGHLKDRRARCTKFVYETLSGKQIRWYITWPVTSFPTSKHQTVLLHCDQYDNSLRPPPFTSPLGGLIPGLSHLTTSERTVSCFWVARILFLDRGSILTNWISMASLLSLSDKSSSQGTRDSPICIAMQRSRTMFHLEIKATKSFKPPGHKDLPLQSTMVSSGQKTSTIEESLKELRCPHKGQQFLLGGAIIPLSNW